MVTHAQRLKNGITTALLALLSLAWVYPVVMILLNSLKTERAITTKGAFELPTAETFAGLQNYVDALNSKGFLSAFGNSLLITVTAVALILVCCSMVHHARFGKGFKAYLLPVRVFDGRAVSDADVHAFRNGG